MGQAGNLSTLGKQRQEDPRDLGPANLVELARLRFGERSCLKNIRQRVIAEDTPYCPLASMCAYLNMHARTHTHTPHTQPSISAPQRATFGLSHKWHGYVCTLHAAPHLAAKGQGKQNKTAALGIFRKTLNKFRICSFFF